MPFLFGVDDACLPFIRSLKSLAKKSCAWISQGQYNRGVITRDLWD